jgi:hypothetical protein
MATQQGNILGEPRAKIVDLRLDPGFKKKTKT